MPRTPPPEIKTGQIWLERDKRFTRFIKIIGTASTDDKIEVKTCDTYGNVADGVRSTYVGRARLPKGFTLATDVK